jgi:hypothetical protein
LLEECSKDNTPEIKSRVVDIKNLLKSWAYSFTG